jgi:hypothetical protein
MLRSKMKTLASILFLVVTTFVIAVAEEAKRDYGFKHTEDFRLEGYDFKFVKAVPDANHWRMGYFKFRWNGAKAIRLWGFGFEKDGSFRVRFEQFSKKTKGLWEEVTVGYCGTGAEMFTLEPNRDYVLQIPLWPYKKDDDEGVVKLGGEKISVISEAFKVSEIRDKR